MNIIVATAENPSRATTRWLQRPAVHLAGLCAAFLLFAAVYLAIIPPFEGFDSFAHYSAITHLRVTRQPQMLDRATADISYELIAQPPLYHGLAALATSWLPVEPTAAFAKASVNPYFQGAQSKRRSITPVEQPLLALLPLWIMRLVSLLGGLLAVVSAWWLARAFFPGAPLVALATGSIVAFNPQFLYMATAIENDAWPAATAALAVAVTAWLTMRTRRPSLWFWAGAALGLALMAKYSTVLVSLPLAVLGIVYWRATGWRRALAACGFALLGLALVAGPWYGRNLWLYGEPLPLTQMAVALPTLNRNVPFTLAETWAFVPWLRASYWGVFMALIAPPLYLETTRAFMWIGLLGLIPLWLRRPSANMERQRLAAVVCLAWGIPVALAVVYWTRTVEFGEEGRLAHIANAGYALIFVLGWQAWAPRRAQRWLQGAIVLFMLTLAASLIPFLYTSYRLPTALAAPPTPDRPLNVRFDGGMQLLGLDLPAGAGVRPGAGAAGHALLDHHGADHRLLYALHPSGRCRQQSPLSNSTACPLADVTQRPNGALGRSLQTPI